jgi:hypothetical protein
MIDLQKIEESLKGIDLGTDGLMSLNGTVVISQARYESLMADQRSLKKLKADAIDDNWENADFI